MNENVLAQQNNANMASFAYIAMLVGLFIPFVALAGVVMAYVYRGGDPVVDSHFSNIIKVFWISLVVGFIGVILCFVVVGWFVLIGLYVWSIYRMVKGLSALRRNEAF